MTIAPSTILIANIRLIGDVILTTPLIGLLKEVWPEAAIDMLVNGGTGEFLEKDPRVRTVFYVNKASGKNRYLHLIFRRYDLAINMNASDRGNIAVVLAGKRIRLGFYNSGRFWKNLWQRLLLSSPLSLPDDIPVARYCQIVAQALRIPHNNLTVEIFWDKADEARVSTMLAEQGVKGHFFVLHPFARWIYKFWDFEKFATVSDYIFERHGLQPIWTSSPSTQEKEQLRAAAGMCRHKPVMIEGELTLNQITYLIRQADFYLGLDTAISHLAASTGTPMVALYGPTFTSRWFPWYNDGSANQECPSTGAVLRLGNIVVVRKELECVPCGKAGCDDSGRFASPCIQTISVDEVVAAVDTLLDEHNVRAEQIEDTMHG